MANFLCGILGLMVAVLARRVFVLRLDLETESACNRATLAAIIHYANLDREKVVKMARQQLQGGE